MLIDPEFSLISPEYDLTLEEVPGVDGDVPIDNKRYKGVSRGIPVYVEPGRNLNQVADDVSNWLKTDVGWHELTFSDNAGYVYNVIHYEQYDIQRLILQYAKAIIPFRFKPYKFYVSGLEEIPLTNGQTINNIGSRPARPLLKVTGNGDMTITIGGQKLELQGVDNGIIIDVLAKVAVNINGRIPDWDKVYTYPFPTIPVGQSTISWTGTATITMIPRWEALLP